MRALAEADTEGSSEEDDLFSTMSTDSGASVEEATVAPPPSDQALPREVVCLLGGWGDLTGVTLHLLQRASRFASAPSGSQRQTRSASRWLLDRPSNNTRSKK